MFLPSPKNSHKGLKKFIKREDIFAVTVLLIALTAILLFLFHDYVLIGTVFSALIINKLVNLLRQRKEKISFIGKRAVWHLQTVVFSGIKITAWLLHLVFQFVKKTIKLLVWILYKLPVSLVGKLARGLKAACLWPANTITRTLNTLRQKGGERRRQKAKFEEQNIGFEEKPVKPKVEKQTPLINEDAEQEIELEKTVKKLNIFAKFRIPLVSFASLLAALPGKILRLPFRPLMLTANFGKKKIRANLRRRQEKKQELAEEKQLAPEPKEEEKPALPRPENLEAERPLLLAAPKYESKTPPIGPALAPAIAAEEASFPTKEKSFWQVKELTPPANVQEERMIAPNETGDRQKFWHRAVGFLKATLFSLRFTRRAVVIFFLAVALGTFGFSVSRQVEDQYVTRPTIEQQAKSQEEEKEGAVLGEKKTSETKTAASVKTKLALSQLIGQFLAAIALLFGMFFFVYSLKYYSTIILVLLASQSANQGGKMGRVSGFFYHLFFKGNGINGQNGNGNGAVGLLPNFQEDKPLPSYPFVCIQLPFYNEKKVVNRILTACTSFDYPNYEVVVADDSTDETIEILAQWQNHPRVKILHREDRSGFKGGALREAMKIQDPRTEFVIIFDADFIPYPDTIKQFLKYFLINGDEVHSYKDTNLAAVQGYQWHVLNKNENWITRSVRTEFSGSYVIERPGTELVGSLKQIAGSVYMIRADVLAAYNWTDSITEDFELTMRIYRDGWKVIFTPYIQAPAECVSTIKRLIRQRMRWAEGHTNNIRRYFWSMLKSPYMSRREKAEFLYLAPYYLQSAFLLVGTACWFVSDVLLHAHLPFWTAFWGWSLVFTNLFALPLMNTIGLFFEESSERDYLGTFSFLALCYILAPFQALAAIRGLFAKEGGWFRTPKSGHITDLYFRSRYRRWFRSLFPGRKKRGAKEGRPETHYLKLATSHSKFQDFKVKKRKGARTIVNLLCLLLVGATLVLNILGSRLPSYSQSYTLKPVEQAIEKYEETTGTAEQTTGEEITEKTPAEENAIDQSAPSQTDNDNVTAAP
ncbi:MAG: glycosyltransferase, partial [Patescibacteria group bacterium]